MKTKFSESKKRVTLEEAIKERYDLFIRYRVCILVISRLMDVSKERVEEIIEQEIKKEYGD
jgi:hypothetical protein